jgi:cytochrome c
MASLEINKFAAGIICAGLLAMAAGKVADVMVHPQQLEKNAYVVDIGALESAAAPKESGGPSLEPVMAMLASADVAAGQKIFKKCSACHSVDKGYSDALKGMGGNWDYASLNGFLTKPKAYVPGTKMSFAGLKKVGHRASVIVYLRSLADSPVALPSAEDIAKETNGS